MNPVLPQPCRQQPGQASRVQRPHCYALQTPPQPPRGVAPPRFPVITPLAKGPTSRLCPRSPTLDRRGLLINGGIALTLASEPAPSSLTVWWPQYAVRYEGNWRHQTTAASCPPSRPSPPAASPRSSDTGPRPS